LDFDQCLVGLLCSVEGGLELSGRHIAQVAVQAGGVVPVDPSEGGQPRSSMVFHGPPRAGPRTSSAL